MRSTYLLLILGLPAAAAVSAVWFGLELRRFAVAVPCLRTTAHIEALKRTVARQMYAALVHAALLALPPIVFFHGLLKGALEARDLPLVLLPAAGIIVIVQLNRKYEARVRETPAADPELEEVRNAIVRTWIRRPLPNW